MNKIVHSFDTTYRTYIEQVHNRGVTGEGISVAVLDTGIYPHQDFRLPKNRVLGFRDYVNRRALPYDDNGHGTHVCGIIASAGKCGGQKIGVAPGASLVGVKVLNRDGGGRLQAMLDAMDWLLFYGRAMGIRLINISVGMTLEEGKNPEEEPLVRKVEELWDSGMIVVAAAGNEGPEPGTVTSPGISRKIITVGALEQEAQPEKKKRFSGCGPVPGTCVCKPDVVAPAVGILSCDNKPGAYVRRSGTSMAAPIVTGILALLLSDQPWLSNLEVKIRLMETGIDCGMPKNQQGWGLVNIEKLF